MCQISFCNNWYHVPFCCICTGLRFLYHFRFLINIKFFSWLVNLQVKNLKQKSEIHDAVLQKAQKKAEESSFLAAEEFAKFKASIEVMKSLDKQVYLALLLHIAIPYRNELFEYFNCNLLINRCMLLHKRYYVLIKIFESL